MMRDWRLILKIKRASVPCRCSLHTEDRMDNTEQIGKGTIQAHWSAAQNLPNVPGEALTTSEFVFSTLQGLWFRVAVSPKNGLYKQLAWHLTELAP